MAEQEMHNLHCRYTATNTHRCRETVLKVERGKWMGLGGGSGVNRRQKERCTAEGD